MSSSFMADIGAMGAESITAKKSTSREGNTEMKMEDFLTLMVVQLQNQTIDDTADTGEMLNQLVQMQMVTALSNMTDASVMSYASSLVGKEVTIGYVDGENNLHEEVLNVIGTGLYDGQQVIFCDDGKMYQLSQIMAVGRVPDLKKGEETKDEDEFKKNANAKVDATIDKINSGYYDDDNSDSETGNDAVSGTDAENTAENSTETETEANDGTTDDPLKGGLLDGMLGSRNTTGETDTDETNTGDQVAPTNET